MWVRRAAAVSLIPSVRKAGALDVAYQVAEALHRDREDLIRKAVGWLLREAGKTDPVRLERYLRRNGPSIPRTTIRYAIERMPPAKRLTSHAPQSASNVFPLAMPSDVKMFPSVVRFTKNAPTKSAGHTRNPRTSNAASAIPAGGHTGDALL